MIQKLFGIHVKPDIHYMMKRANCCSVHLFPWQRDTTMVCVLNGELEPS